MISLDSQKSGLFFGQKSATEQGGSLSGFEP
jgi:hypothetical protein